MSGAKTILLIHSNPVGSIWPPLFRDPEYRFYHVPSGIRAIEFIRNSCLNLIILVVIEDMSLAEFIQQLDKTCPDLPILIVGDNMKRLWNTLQNESISHRIHLCSPDPYQISKKISAVVDQPQQRQKSPTRSFLTLLFQLLFQKRLLCHARKNSCVHPIPSHPSHHTVDLNRECILGVNFFGSFCVILDHKDTGEWTPHVRNLFAFLAYYHNRRWLRDLLIEKFWSHSSAQSARNSLNVALCTIRHRLDAVRPDVEYICFRDDCYFINPDVDLVLDTDDFLQAWRLAQVYERNQNYALAISHLEWAAAIYKGDFMSEDLYEPWTELERENLSEIYLVVLDKLSLYYARNGHIHTAISLCEQILKRDNCREDIHCRLMKIFHQLGYRYMALRQYNKCKEALLQEFQAKPTLTTQSLFEQIKNDQKIKI